MIMFRKKNVAQLTTKLAQVHFKSTLKTSLSWLFVASQTVLTSQTLIGCLPKSQNAASAKAIIGEDRLTPVLVPKLLSTVGQLRIKDRICSAFVSAPNQIVSATHCLINGTAARTDEITFKAGDGKMTGVKRVIQWDAKRDIMTLETIESFTDHLEQGAASTGSFTLVGYDGNTDSLSYDTLCSTSANDAIRGFLTHDCSSRPGFSGSPIMQNGVVVALHLGYIEKINKNLALKLPSVPTDGVDIANTSLSPEGGMKFDFKLSPPKNPLEGVKIGAAVGTLLGSGMGSAVGAAFGALVGKHNEMQDTIDRLKREGDQRQAELIQAKLDRSRDQEAAKNAASSSAAQLNCVNGRDNANTFFLGAIGKSQDDFNNCLINASDGPGSQGCLDNFQAYIKTQLDLAKQIYSCQ